MLQTRLVAKQVEEEVRPCKSSSFRRLEEGEGGHSVNSVAFLLSQQHLQRRRRRGAPCDLSFFFYQSLRRTTPGAPTNCCCSPFKTNPTKRLTKRFLKYASKKNLKNNQLVTDVFV
jgi:hypothetical protein